MINLITVTSCIRYEGTVIIIIIIIIIICKEIEVKLDNEHWYNHVPISVETGREG